MKNRQRGFVFIIIIVVVALVLGAGAVWYFNPGGILGSNGYHSATSTANTTGTSGPDQTASGSNNPAPVSVGEGIISKGVYYSNNISDINECINIDKKGGLIDTHFYVDYKNTTNAELKVTTRLLYGPGYGVEAKYPKLEKYYIVKINEIRRFDAVTNVDCYSKGIMEIYKYPENILLSRTEIGN